MLKLESKSKKTILFRADDLNGATAEIVLTIGAREKIDKVVECSKENINESLSSFLNSKEFYEYNKVYIIGHEFDKKIGDKIEDLHRDDSIDTKFIYRDHHNDNSYLHKYMWSKVLVLDYKEHPICSSRLLFREIVPKSNSKYLRLLILTDIVNAIVTGFTPEEDESMAEKINELYNVTKSSSEFVRDISEKIMSNEPFFNEEDLLAIEEAKRLKEEEMEKIKALKAELNSRNRNRGI